MNETLLKESINRLESWLDKNGWAGLDPYTLQDKLYKTKFYRKYGKSRYIKHACFKVLQIFPEYLLPLLKPEPEINAKGMGLLAKGYLNLYQTWGDETYLKRATEIFEWLVEHRNHTYPGYCWGYPFDWQSETLIPKDTPSSVVTVFVGYAFLHAWECTKDERYLSVIQKIAQFLSSSLNQSYRNENEVCFSYTPLDNMHVINANLFVGDFLAKTAKWVEDSQHLVQTAKKIYNYTLRCQNPDGSFYYYGPEQEVNPYVKNVLKIIDHYHTGFVLRSLASLHDELYGKTICEPVNKGLRFYMENLFDGFIPKYLPDRKYPVNIHSVSEALLMLNHFSAYTGAKVKLEKLIPWVIKNFQDKSGYFYYNLFPLKRAKIAYLRWGQAWMFYALSEIFKKESF